MALIVTTEKEKESKTAKAVVNKGYVFLVCAITALGGLLFGFDLVAISGAIPFLSEHFQLNEYEKGWAVGCINLGCVLGALAAGRLSDRWGRKKLLMLCATLFVITGVGTGWATEFNIYILFRVLSGVAVGAAALVCPMYTAEIAPAHLRGRMVSFYQLAVTTGVLLAYLSNWFLLDTGAHNWRWMFTAQSVPGVFFLIGIFFVSESPRWMIRKGRITEAGKVLSKIGGAAYANEQVQVIRQSFARETKERFADIFGKKTLPILLIGLAVAVCSQAVGQNSLFSYAPEIFRQAGMGDETAFIQSLIIGVINVIFTFIAISLIDRIGRKTLLQTGAALLFVDALMLAAAFYFQWSGIWTLVFVLGFIAVYASTIGPVTWVLLSEIFPNRIRGNAMAMATFWLWIANFFVTASFPVSKAQLGLPATFAIHGLICLAYFLFIRRNIPETRGQSLEKIETILTK